MRRLPGWCIHRYIRRERKGSSGGVDPVKNVARNHAKETATAHAKAKPIIGEMAKAGKFKVVAARYDLISGQVGYFP